MISVSGAVPWRMKLIPMYEMTDGTHAFMLIVLGVRVERGSAARRMDTNIWSQMDIVLTRCRCLLSYANDSSLNIGQMMLYYPKAYSIETLLQRFSNNTRVSFL